MNATENFAFQKTLYLILIKSTEITEIHAVNTNTLQIQSTIRLNINMEGLIFVDEDHLCLLSSAEEVSDIR